ncbi:MAG: hypothetical protein ABEK02_01435 [Haloquadratum sp.]
MPGDDTPAEVAADRTDDEDATDATDHREPPIPLDGDVLRYTAATASVPPKRIAPLLRRVQTHLAPRLDAYRRAHECVVDGDERAVFLAREGHWADVGDDLDLDAREVDTVRRAHDQQLRRLGTKRGRRDELETALDIREAVVIGVGGPAETA